MKTRPATLLARRARRAGGDRVLTAVPQMRPGAVVGCCVSLLVAGVLLARGFVGVLPSRPMYLVLGGVLAGTALLSLVIDHVSVVVRHERPDQVLVSELDRSRRHGHPLTLVAVRCDDDEGLEVVSRLRTTDRAWHAGDSLFVLLVETDRTGAEPFVSRLEPLVSAERVRAAAFPEDAVTADGLYRVLGGPAVLPVDLEEGEVISDPGPAPKDLDGAMSDTPRVAGA